MLLGLIAVGGSALLILLYGSYLFRFVTMPVRAIAGERGVLPGQVALAWVHAQGADLVPIPGTKRRTYLDRNVAAADLALTDDDLARLDGLADQTVGARY